MGALTSVRAHVCSDARLAEGSVAVVAGVRSRSSLPEEIFERVRTCVPELKLDGDAERGARARVAISTIMGYCLDTIEHGAAHARMPQAALERARVAAREGASIAPLLRAVVAGYQPFVAAMIVETQRLPESVPVREHLRETHERLLGDLMAALEREYERERATAGFAPELNGVAHNPDVVLALTRREREVLELLLAGRSYREIAQALWVTPDTIHTHTSRVYRKLGVSGRRELVRQQR